MQFRHSPNDSGSAPAAEPAIETSILEGASEAQPPAQPPATSTPPIQPAEEVYWQPDGTFKPGWQAHLGIPEEKHASLTHPNIKEVVESFIETKSLVGKKQIERPGENATEDQIAEYNNHMRKLANVPESPEGYRSIKPEGISEEEWNSEQTKEFTELAFKHNTSPEAVRDFMQLHAKMVQGSEVNHAEQLNAYKSEQIQELRETWKSDYDNQINAAKRFAATIGVDLSDPIFADASVVKAFASGASMVSEDKLLQGDAIGLVRSRNSRAQEDMRDPKNSLRAEEYNGLHGEERQARAAESIRADLKSGT